MQNHLDRASLVKFIVGTVFGITFVLIPFNFGGTVDTILFYYVKMFVKAFNGPLTALLVLCIVASALLSLFNLVNQETIFYKNRLMMLVAQISDTLKRGLTSFPTNAPINSIAPNSKMKV